MSLLTWDRRWPEDNGGRFCLLGPGLERVTLERQN